jgi:RNA polymerase sigma-70 factor (ECF subfamily)
MPRHRGGIGSSKEDDGDERRRLDEFFVARYAELRRVAGGLKRGDGSLTLSPTALVSEAWLRLAHAPHVRIVSPAHFKALAARVMRQVLTDSARRRRAGKRTAPGTEVTVVFDDSIGDQVAAAQDVLGLDAALRDLERISPRQAALVEARYFGGLTVDDLADVLGVSRTTVEREWRVAKAWLKTQLRPR